MKRFYSLIFILILATCGHAQHWVEVGNLNANLSIKALCTDALGNVYAGGVFTDSADASGGFKYVAKYDGTVWWSLGRDSAHALRALGDINALTADATGGVYAAGNFLDINGRTYVAKWDGSIWQHLGIDTSGLNSWQPIYTLAADAGHVYAAGALNDSVFAYGHYYVAVWDGYWHELGLDTTSGLNANGAIYTLAVGPQHHVYAAGNFTDTSTGFYYVGEYDGTSWRMLGSGASALRANGPITDVITDRAGNVYATGEFTDTSGHFYIAKWNGMTWSMLRSANDQFTVLGPITALAADTAGNVFGAGMIPDSSGNFVTVIKWNGSYLAEAGGLLANDAILCMAADASGNVFAAGSFKDPNSTQYVAAYTTTILPTGISAIGAAQYRIYPNPVSGHLYIETDGSSASLELRDVSGRVLHSADVVGQASIDMSSFSAGMYLLTIRSSMGQISVIKVVKD